MTSGVAHRSVITVLRLVSVEQGVGQLRTRCPAPPRLGCTPLDTSSMAQQGVTYTGEVGSCVIHSCS